jgi:transcriptional regulator with GAF, ATPase, and Fis domain
MSTSIHSLASLKPLLSKSVLIVSDSVTLQHLARKRAQHLTWQFWEARSGADALEILTQEGDAINLILVERELPDLLAEEFIGLIEHYFSKVEMCIMHVVGDQLCLETPSKSKYAAQFSACSANSKSNCGLAPQGSYLDEVKQSSGMAGNSQVMQKAYSLIHLVAKRKTTVLVTGESGTGKDLAVQAVHALSERRQKPLVIINCAALPESLLEAELFGYDKGAFTGALQSRLGRIHAAHGGTLFLDEIGDMPLPLQSKLLRFLEQGELQRLGSNVNIKVDVRVVAATNAGLGELVARKLFREDLLYRLAVFIIDLPPLRGRAEDIPMLVAGFVKKFSPGVLVTSDALARLSGHSWPGNVRELRNVMERASILMGNERALLPQHIVF